VTKIGRKLFRARRPEIPRSRDDRAGLLDTFGAASILLLVLRAAQVLARVLVVADVLPVAVLVVVVLLLVAVAVLGCAVDHKAERSEQTDRSSVQWVRRQPEPKAR